MSEPAGFEGGTAEREGVLVALSRVMADVQAVSKDSRNTQQNYNFRGIDAVVNAVGPAFRAHGIVCVPLHVELLADERYTTKSGTEMRNVTLRVTWRFHGPAGDWVDAESAGEAADAGDKAVPKAHSVAYRTVLLQALCIPTDDPDPDASSHEREPRRQERPANPGPKGWAELEQRVKAADNPDEAWALFTAFLRAGAYHLFGKTEQAELEQAQRDVLWQKAAGALLWLEDNPVTDGPFQFYDEAVQRRAWAHVLDGHALEIPDYVPPEPPAEEPSVDEVDDANRALDEAAAHGALEVEKNESS